MDSIYRNLNIKDLNDETKISIKNDNTYNNINIKLMSKNLIIV